MDDKKIVSLLFDRSEKALEHLAQKYERLCYKIAIETVQNESDAEECINDLWLAVWESIPPNNPDYLISYVCKLSRRIAINKYKHNNRQKRAAGAEFFVPVSDLDSFVSDIDGGFSDADNENLCRILSDFIAGLAPETRVLFIRRYVYLESVKDLSERYQMKENNISVKLFRAKNQLKKTLEKESIII